MVVPPKQGYCRNYSHMRRLSPIVFDNYYIRVLLGGDVMRLPTGALNDEHRRQAERVLRQMDLVLLSNAAATPTALQNATGIVNYTACRAPRPSACQMTAEDEERALRRSVTAYNDIELRHAVLHGIGHDDMDLRTKILGVDTAELALGSPDELIHAPNEFFRLENFYKCQEG